jgi:hypothetical protein
MVPHLYVCRRMSIRCSGKLAIELQCAALESAFPQSDFGQAFFDFAEVFLPRQHPRQVQIHGARRWLTKNFLPSNPLRPSLLGFDGRPTVAKLASIGPSIPRIAGSELVITTSLVLEAAQMLAIAALPSTAKTEFNNEFPR